MLVHFCFCVLSSSARDQPGQGQSASEEFMYLIVPYFSLVPCTLAPHKWTASTEDKNKQPGVEQGDKTPFFHDHTSLILLMKQNPLLQVVGGQTTRLNSKNGKFLCPRTVLFTLVQPGWSALQQSSTEVCTHT